MSETVIDRTPHGLAPAGFMEWATKRAAGVTQEIPSLKKDDVDLIAAMAGVPVDDHFVDIMKNVAEVAKPKSILQEADAVAGESRSRDYGHPHINHRRIAAIWNVVAEQYLKSPLTPRVVALMMIGLKLAREVNTKKRDNLVDMAGYIKCVDMIDEHIEKASNGV
jgi:hypothetical protein